MFLSLSTSRLALTAISLTMLISMPILTYADTASVDHIRITVHYTDASGVAQIAISNGFTMTGATHTVDAELTDPDLDIDGNFTIGENATFSASQTGGFLLAGNFTNAGTFTHNSGTVNLNANTGTQTLSGTTNFYNLTKTGSTTQTLQFSKNGQQSVSGALVLQGAASNLISLRSEETDTAVRLILDGGSGTQDLEYLDVKDNDASGGAELDCFTASGCVNSGNNTNWNFGAEESNNSFFFFFGF